MSAVERACELIRRFEGLRLEAYADPVHGWKVPTIGYGATGPGIVRGTVWTREQAEADLERRVRVLVADVLAVCERPLPDDAVAALTSLAYNVGFKPEDPLRHSHLVGYVREGMLGRAADEFPRWDHAGGREVPELRKRREAERAIFLGAIARTAGVA